MSGEQASAAVVGIRRLAVSPRVRMVVVTAAIGATLIGFLTSYLRRRRRSRRRANSANAPQREDSSTRLMPAPEEAVRVRRWLNESRQRPSSNQSNDFRLNNGVAGNSVANVQTGIYLGMENLLDAIRLWEKAMATSVGRRQQEGKPAEDDGLMASLDSILRQARALQADVAGVVERYHLEAPDALSVASGAPPAPPFAAAAAATSAGSMRRQRGALSVLSDDSFVSALEDIPIFEDLDILQREPLTIAVEKQYMFLDGLNEVGRDAVRCRNMRFDFVRCTDESEFLAKLWCLRQAFDVILMDSHRRMFLTDTGRQLMAELMRHASKDPSPFYREYDSLLYFLQNEAVWSDVASELHQRNVPCLSFYDVVLDFILMDAFDDLAHPPSAVSAVTRNPFLSDGLKQTTLSTLVWSVLKAKRSRLSSGDGFVARFYNVSEQVSPVLAWGFLGTDERLKELCHYFKEQICAFMVDMFNSERVRFTRVDELAEDVWLILRTRAELAQQRLSSELLPAEL